MAREHEDCDGHYPEATSLAFKYLEKKVQKHSGLTAKSGDSLMMEAFDGTKIKLNALVTVSEKDEQAGYRFIFTGGTRALAGGKRKVEAFIAAGGDIKSPEACQLGMELVLAANQIGIERGYILKPVRKQSILFGPSPQVSVKRKGSGACALHCKAWSLP